MAVKIPAEIKEIYNKLADAGYEAYLVGGCVRDLLLGRVPKDWDITTNAKPEEIQKIFPADESFYENDFGTVGVKTGSEDPALAVVEVTPYRIEEKYTDKRHPDEVKFAKKLEDDLKRRDFTLNATALEIQKSKIKNQNENSKFKIIDPYKGQEDLKNKVVRAVGEPEKRFDEDALRLMRAVRLATELGFQIEKKTREAIGKKHGLLEFVSKERARDELSKLLMADEPSRGLEDMRGLGLLKFVMPELEEGWEVGQNKHHIYGVWEHDMRSLDYAAKKNWPLDIRMSALLHDVGKPRTKQGDGPDSTFYNHEVVGSMMTFDILSRLKFPAKFVKKVSRLVRFHLFYYNVGEVTESSVRRLLRKVGPEYIDDLLRVRMCDRIGSGVPKAEPYKLRHLRFMVDKVKRDPISVTQLAIDGKDVMEICKIKPGPKIGYILSVLLEEVLDDIKLNTKKNLAAKTKELCKEPENKLKKMADEARRKKETFEEKELGEIKKRYFVK